MPLTPPVRRDVGVSRRTAVGVAAATATVASGCTPHGVARRPRTGPSRTRSRGTDPDVALAATVLADEQGMLDRVLATLGEHPGLEPVLSGARSAHSAHVELLTDAVPVDARPSTPSPPSSASPSSGHPSRHAATAVPTRRRAALAALSREEDRLGLLARRSAFAAESGVFARVLASMAAAAAQQAETLVAAAKDSR